MKTIVVSGLVAAAALTLAACGNRDEAAPAATDASTDANAAGADMNNGAMAPAPSDTAAPTATPTPTETAAPPVTSGTATSAVAPAQASDGRTATPANGQVNNGPVAPGTPVSPDRDYSQTNPRPN